MLIDLTLSVDIDDPVIQKASSDNSYMSKGHIGTHLDVYVPQPVPPVHYCERNGVLIDAGAVGNNAEIGVDILAGRTLHNTDFLIVYAGWLERHVYGSKDYYREHPQFSWELIWELARSQIAFVGIDFAGMRRGEEHGPADKAIADGGGYVIENLANVNELVRAAGGRNIRMITGWTGFRGSSGLACRVVADVVAAA